MMDRSSVAWEAQRQQRLLAALWRGSESDALADLVRDPAGRAQQALQVYRANAGASAERALAASFPTVRQLLGETSFAAMARAYWHHRPPRRGDLAWLGERLPEFIAADAQLADVPYLADMARLEWALACAEAAADAEPELQTLSRLADADASTLRIELMPGVAVVASAHPIVTIHAAHRDGGKAAFAAACAAIDHARAETALVWRVGWHARCAALDAADARFTAQVLAGRSLGEALAAAPGNDFQRWLVCAVEDGWLRAVRSLPTAPPEGNDR